MDDKLQSVIEAVLGNSAGVFGIGVGIGLFAAWRLMSEDVDLDVERIKHKLAESEAKTDLLMDILTELAKKLEERA